MATLAAGKLYLSQPKETKLLIVGKLKGYKKYLALGKMEYSKENYLPAMASDAESLREGRNVRDGYARGWGLQFGELREKVRNDKLYQEAVAIAQGRTVVSEDNRMNIFLILKFAWGNPVRPYCRVRFLQER